RRPVAGVVDQHHVLASRLAVEELAEGAPEVRQRRLLPAAGRQGQHVVLGVAALRREEAVHRLRVARGVAQAGDRWTRIVADADDDRIAVGCLHERRYRLRHHARDCAHHLRNVTGLVAGRDLDDVVAGLKARRDSDFPASLTYIARSRSGDGAYPSLLASTSWLPGGNSMVTAPCASRI